MRIGLSDDLSCEDAVWGPLGVERLGGVRNRIEFAKLFQSPTSAFRLVGLTCFYKCSPLASGGHTGNSGLLGQSS